MTRQEFFKTLWIRFLKPILILGVLVILIQFFFNALNEESDERQLINLMAFGLAVGALMISIGLLFTYVWTLVWQNMPEGVRKYYENNSKWIVRGLIGIV